MIQIILFYLCPNILYIYIQTGIAKALPSVSTEKTLLAKTASAMKKVSKTQVSS